jgi:peptide/nickel transport system substrate-binding protein
MWFLNMNNQYLSNLQVRQAILYAANRLDYIGSVGSAATPADSVIDGAYPFGISNTHTEKANLGYNFNLTKAQQLMTSGGYPNGFTLKLDAVATNLVPYEILQAQLAKINITININPVDATTYQKDIATTNEPLFTNALGFFGTPQQAFQNYFEGSAALNWQHYSGADALIQKAAKTLNPVAQQKLWTSIDDKILSDAAVIPLYTSQNVYAGSCGFTWGGANPPVKIPSSWDGTYLATVNRSQTNCQPRQ